MSTLKKLAGQTAIYGLSSIVGRLLNYFLVPLYTRIFLPEAFGVVTELYAYVTFLNIIFTYGMETGYFRFSQEEPDPAKVYSTSMWSLIISSIGLFVLLFVFRAPASEAMRYPDHPEYVTWFACILALDAITSIPFARLRQENKSLRFAFVKLINIFSNIGFNLFFLLLCPFLVKQGYEWVNLVYDPSIGVGYVFISNLISSALTLLFLAPQLTEIRGGFDGVLWKRMLMYSLPLLLAGTAGMVNETVDRILLKQLYPDPGKALEQVGIYGACYKLSILMTLFIQTFRYAAEPFFFSHAKKENAKDMYAQVMKYFVIGCSLIFLGVMVNMDIIKFFIGEKFHSGLHVVPILLFANLCLGIFFNLSIWYKLSGQTKYGAYLAVYGAVVTIVLNVWWIPIYGYHGCAWATLICYGSMMVLSYFLGQKNFPVRYELKSILGYLATALVLYALSYYMERAQLVIAPLKIFVNNLLVLIFLIAVYLVERTKKFVP